MEKITRETTIHDALSINPDAAQILMAYGMHCFGCAMARGETVADAAMAHGADVDEMLEKLNEGIEG